jgi:ATP-dependent helicase/DNAse subunit B
LAQISSSAITPDDLKAASDWLTEDSLKRKVDDLALIYEEYLRFLRDKAFLDESKYLSLLPEKLRKEKTLKGCNVFFVGYNAFTAQARETICAALETADNVIGIFCAGEEELYCNKAAQAFASPYKEEDKNGKVDVIFEGKPLEGTAEVLRKGLFNPMRCPKTYSDNVAIYEGIDKNAEAEYAAMKIRRALHENPDLRYRDIAILVPSVGGYSLPIKKARIEYKIPYFIVVLCAVDIYVTNRYAAIVRIFRIYFNIAKRKPAFCERGFYNILILHRKHIFCVQFNLRLFHNFNAFYIRR